MSTVPATSRTRAATAARDMAVASRPTDSRGRSGCRRRRRRQRSLQPPLGRPQHTLGHQRDHHEEAEATEHPTVPERIGPLAHGQQDEPEDGDAVDGAARPS